MDGFPVESDLTLRDVAFVNIEQAGNRPNGGSFAGSVGAQKGDDLPIRNLQTDSAQHEDHVVVNDFYAFDRQQPGLL